MFVEEMDPEVIELVKALNLFPGIKTVESCCGHGKDTFNIWFAADDLKRLPQVLWYISGCHNGIYGWAVEVTTDCSMRPVKFRLGSSSKGKAAYAEAEQIAKFIRGRVD